jgi:RNA polymerase sigma-70 factor (ECF subfamily)
MATSDSTPPTGEEDAAFQDLIRRIRAGDQQAATELVRQFEPEIRRAVRFRLNSPKLGRVLDSMDVCQSVMGRFFFGVAAGQFELQNSGQLLRLLVTMAKNRVIDHARKPSNRPDSFGGDDREYQVPGRGDTPSVSIVHNELLSEMRKRLSPEERQLSEMRTAGEDWATIAEKLGGSPEALRKKLERAMDRVTKELGLG